MSHRRIAAPEPNILPSNTSWFERQTHAQLYSCWASTTCAGVGVAIFSDWLIERLPWPMPDVRPATVVGGMSLTFALVSMGFLLSTLIAVCGLRQKALRPMYAQGLSAAGVLCGVLTAAGAASTTEAWTVSLSASGDGFVSTISAASAACIATSTSGSMARWSPVRRSLQMPAVFGAGYLMLLAFLYGLRWTGLLPLGLVLVLASTAAMSCGAASIRGLAPAEPAESDKSWLFRHRALVLFVLLFPVVLGVGRGFDGAHLGAGLFIMSFVASLSLTAVVLGAFDWLVSTEAVAHAARQADETRQTLTAVEVELAATRVEKDRIEQIDRNRAQLMTRLGHELRTPLTTLLGFAQLLERDCGSTLTKHQHEALRFVEKAGQHLQVLVEDFMDLSLADAGQLRTRMKMIPLGHFLKDTVALLEPLASSRGVSLHYPALEAEHSVWADEVRLKQIMINLIDNALKYNRKGGAVWVTARMNPLPEAPTGEVLRNIEISVCDNGQGIPASKIDHLFEPFNRLGQETGSQMGSGVGLALSKVLAKLMDGNIVAFSNIGAGTTMTLKLKGR